MGQVVALAQFADVVSGGQQPWRVFVGQAQLATGCQPQAEEYRIELRMQLAQAQVVAQALAVAHFNAADLQHEIHLTLGKIVHQLIFGNPVLIEPAGFIPGFENHHLMAV